MAESVKLNLLHLKSPSSTGQSIKKYISHKKEHNIPSQSASEGLQVELEPLNPIRSIISRWFSAQNVLKIEKQSEFGWNSRSSDLDPGVTTSSRRGRRRAQSGLRRIVKMPRSLERPQIPIYSQRHGTDCPEEP